MWGTSATTASLKLQRLCNFDALRSYLRSESFDLKERTEFRLGNDEGLSLQKYSALTEAEGALSRDQDCLHIGLCRRRHCSPWSPRSRMPFIQKPFSPSILLQKVREVLDNGTKHS
jgi:hypothetical protein